VDVEREMEALAREARKKLEAERAQSDELASHVARSTAKSTSTSLGTKLAGALIALAAIWLAWTFVVAPLAKWAILIAIVVAIVWVVWKLAGGGRSEPGEPT
jgi:VIT1/CCC1 family predicted Fe2+/Mn2+ transporter